MTGCDGEVIIVNGVAYHADALGGFRKLSGSECTPYATVTPFEADYSYFVPHITDAVSLLEDIKGKAASENIFFAVKITGKFETMHVRMMPKQENHTPNLNIRPINNLNLYMSKLTELW